MHASEVRVLNGHVVWPAANVEELRRWFPSLRTAVLGGRDYAAAPHDLATVKLFGNLGVALPGPITAGYSWPGRFKPYAHQIETADFLTRNPRAHVLSGMGTGKTKSTLWAIDYLIRVGDIKRAIIFAPLSTLDRVWAQEAFETLPHRRAVVVYGPRAKRLELLARPADIYIANHDGAEILHDALAKRPDITHVVVDESAVLRTATTMRWKTFNSIVNRQHPRGCWGLTGTPTPNAPTDCFGQLKIVTPERYRGSFRGMRDDLMIQISQFRWVPKRDAAMKVSLYLQPSIRHALEDCLDLPETIWSEREAELSPQQRKAYDDLKKFALTEVGGEQVTAVNAAVLLGKMTQAAAGILYDGLGGVIELDFGPRLAVLREVIEESDRKVIVFVPFTGALNALHDALKRDWPCAVVDGNVSAGARNKIFKDFQEATDPHVILAHPGTMAHGLTLTAATTICWYAPTTSNEIFQQANARIARPGQKNVTNIVQIHGCAAERGIYRTLNERGKMQDLVLELAKTT